MIFKKLSFKKLDWNSGDWIMVLSIVVVVVVVVLGKPYVKNLSNYVDIVSPVLHVVKMIPSC